MTAGVKIEPSQLQEGWRENVKDLFPNIETKVFRNESITILGKAWSKYICGMTLNAFSCFSFQLRVSFLQAVHYHQKLRTSIMPIYIQLDISNIKVRTFKKIKLNEDFWRHQSEFIRLFKRNDIETGSFVKVRVQILDQLNSEIFFPVIKSKHETTNEQIQHVTAFQENLNLPGNCHY